MRFAGAFELDSPTISPDLSSSLPYLLSSLVCTFFSPVSDFDSSPDSLLLFLSSCFLSVSLSVVISDSVAGAVAGAVAVSAAVAAAASTFFSANPSFPFSC